VFRDRVLDEGDTPLFLAKLPGYRFVAKKGSVPFIKNSVTEH